MNTLLHLSLEYSSPLRFVEIGDLEDMCCIDPIVGAPAHYMIAGDAVFVYGNLA